jgi:hypothetical protein
MQCNAMHPNAIQSNPIQCNPTNRIESRSRRKRHVMSCRTHYATREHSHMYVLYVLYVLYLGSWSRKVEKLSTYLPIYTVHTYITL